MPPERTCIITRIAQPPDRMIRFVASPDGAVVPDLKNKLPGRGVWVTATKAMVQEAIKRKAFARGLKDDVTAPSSLVEDIESLLNNQLRQGLALANKAGQAVLGFGQVEAAARAGEIACLIHAQDAAEDGKRKLYGAVLAGNEGREIPVLTFSNAEELAVAFGRDHVVHAALKKGPSAVSVLRHWDVLQFYTQKNAAEHGGKR